jgi:uncharacterized membrane protein YhaH (DUF805 family)
MQVNEYLAFWMNYLNFSDRTTVRGYWMAFLFNFIANLVITLISRLLRTNLLTYLFSLAIFLPGLAIAVRRLRDAGKEWTWIFVGLIPLIGPIWLIVLLCKPSTPYSNVPVV